MKEREQEWLQRSFRLTAANKMSRMFWPHHRFICHERADVWSAGDLSGLQRTERATASRACESSLHVWIHAGNTCSTRLCVLPFVSVTGWTYCVHNARVSNSWFVCCHGDVCKQLGPANKLLGSAGESGFEVCRLNTCASGAHSHINDYVC